jgi:Tfp pilus assembly protein PilE
MFRFAILALVVLICLASLSCQTYSTGLQKSLARADETSAIAALHAIAVAEQTYSISNGGNFGTLAQLRDAGYLDVRFNAPNGGVKDYSVTLNANPQSGEGGASFTCNADPTNSGSQAGRHFYIDSTSQAIHVNPTQPATVADPVY